MAKDMRRTYLEMPHDVQKEVYTAATEDDRAVAAEIRYLVKLGLTARRQKRQRDAVERIVSAHDSTQGRELAATMAEAEEAQA